MAVQLHGDDCIHCVLTCSGHAEEKPPVTYTLVGRAMARRKVREGENEGYTRRATPFKVMLTSSADS